MHIATLARTLTAAAIVCTTATPGFAEYSERPELSITRNASSQLTLSASLTKNVYRYVEREIVETIQVPYTVTVPYEAIETYYVIERRCSVEMVPRKICGYERQCTNTPPPHKVCPPPTCHVTPQGKICKQNPCYQPPSAPPTCRDVYVCHIRHVAETVCRNVSVPYTRVVIRYRTETRYRPEERRRTVTDRIFDRQYAVYAQVVLPTESSLQGNEEETVLVKLTGSEQRPDVDVSIDSRIFSYRIAEKTQNGGAITVRLQLVPKFQPEELGVQTIRGLTLARTHSGGHEIRFEDHGLVSRVNTDYHVEIADQNTGRWVFDQSAQAAFGSKLVVIPVTVFLNEDSDHLVRLTVQREGIVLSGPVNFKKEFNQIAQLSPAPYTDPNGVRSFAVTGHEVDAELIFTDATPNDGKVDVEYKVTLERRVWGFLWKKTLAQATFNRANLSNVNTQDGTDVSIPLARFPGLSTKQLLKFFDSGDTVFVEVSVTRTSPRLSGASPVRFTKEAKVKVGRR
jgi:protein involved in ribonucleotide reduction